MGKSATNGVRSSVRVRRPAVYVSSNLCKSVLRVLHHSSSGELVDNHPYHVALGCDAACCNVLRFNVVIYVEHACLQDYVTGTRCPTCTNEIPILVGDAKRLSMQQRRTLPGCQPLEHVYDAWRYGQMTTVTWRSVSLNVRGVVVQDEKSILAGDGFEGELNRDIRLSNDVPGSIKLNRECKVVIVPSRCNPDPRLARVAPEGVAFLSIDDNGFDQVMRDVCSGSYFIRVIAHPELADHFLITYSLTIERASFDTFFVEDAALESSLPVNFYGSMDQNLTVPSFCVFREGGFAIAKGQLPLHEAQDVAGWPQGLPMFVVGPTAWESIHASVPGEAQDVSKLFCIRSCGTYVDVLCGSNS